MRKFIQFLTATITIFFVFLSFSVNAEIKFEAVSTGNLSKSDSLGPVLYKLFIDNSDVGANSTTKFQELINAGKSKGKKIVFQFFFNNGKITLIAFPGPSNHQADFNTAIQLELGIYRTCPNDVSIDGKLVSFGDLEIKNEHGQKIEKELITIADGSKYIFFVPYLETNLGVTTINYSIIPSESMDSSKVCTLTKVNYASVVNINPSPPRKGN